MTKHRKSPWLAALALLVAPPFLSIAAASAAPMTPPPLAPSFSHEEIGPDGAWVVGTFPAGSGVWLVETYNPTDFDHQLLTDSRRVDARFVDVPFDDLLIVFSPTCAQLDVRPEGEEQPTGGGDLKTTGCQETPPPPPAVTAPPAGDTPPPTTTAPPITTTEAPPTTPPPAPAAPPVAPPVADTTPTPTSEVPVVEVNAPTPTAEVGTGVSATREGALPLTGSSNTPIKAAVGLGVLLLGFALTVPKRLGWSRAR